MSPSARPLPALAALTALLLAPPLLGQEAPSALPGVFGEVLDVRVVNIEVVVTDRDGVPVVGLGPEAFVLRVDGEETPIDYFTEIRAGTAVAAAPGEDRQPTAAPPAIVPGDPVGTSYLVFIDELFSISRDRDLVLDKMIDDLPRLGPADRMAIVAYDGDKLEMLSTWSDSQAGLARALKQARLRPTHGLQRLAERRQFDFDQVLRFSSGLRDGVFTTDDFFRADLSPEERFYVERLTEQVERSVTAAASTLRSFAQPPGRKVMVLLSGGWPFLPTAFLGGSISPLILDTEFDRGPALFRPLADTANLLGYTLYPVDVPGFTDEVADASVASPAELPSRAGSIPGAAAEGSFLRRQEVHYTLEFLARETGGRALIDSARLEALDRVASDTRSYYWLGFTPQRGWDDRRHDIAVEIPGSGLRVRSRDSFLDSSRGHEVTMAVESALLFGNPPSEEALRVSVGEPKRAGRGKISLPVEILVPLAELTFLPAADGQVAEVELRIAVRDERGRRADIPVLPIALRSDQDPRPGTWGRYETTLKLRKQNHQAVFAVYDPASGRIFSSSVDIRP